MQKRIEDKLYVFDLVPFEITDGTDAEIIYVQYEHVAGYKELNAELADKITGFNQFVMTVNPPVWAQDVPEPGPEPEPQGHTFTLTGTDILANVKVYFDNEEQTITDGIWSNVAEDTAIFISAEETPDWYTLTSDNAVWDQQNVGWNLTMGDEDITVNINYVEDHGGDVFTYTFTLSGTDIVDAVQVTVNDSESATVLDENGQTSLNQGDVVKIEPRNDTSDYELVSGAEWNEDAWYCTMPAEDHTVVINYNGGESGGDTPEYLTFTFITNDASAFDLSINDETKDPSDGSWNNVLEDEEIIITPKDQDQTSGTYSTSDDGGSSEEPVWDSENKIWTITMPDHNIQVHIDYETGQSGES